LKGSKVHLERQKKKREENWKRSVQKLWSSEVQEAIKERSRPLVITSKKKQKGAKRGGCEKKKMPSRTQQQHKGEAGKRPETGCE